MSLAVILQEHTSLCEQTYQLVLEENCLLKKNGQPPDETFLEKKRRLLSRMDASLAALRQQSAEFKAEVPACHAAMEKAQQVILKTLLLDRENEQLLLKCSITMRPPAVTLKPSASHLQKLYQRQGL